MSGRTHIVNENIDRRHSTTFGEKIFTFLELFLLGTYLKYNINNNNDNSIHSLFIYVQT
jgi:hypothetical protein